MMVEKLIKRATTPTILSVTDKGLSPPAMLLMMRTNTTLGGVGG
jgi:hypothetical protein